MLKKVTTNIFNTDLDEDVAENGSVINASKSIFGARLLIPPHTLGSVLAPLSGN